METEYQGTLVENTRVFYLLVQFIQPGIWTIYSGHARALEVPSELPSSEPRQHWMLVIIKSLVHMYEER